MKIEVLSVLALTLLAPLAQASAVVIDTNSVASGSAFNYWPFGDADNTTYQLWLSHDVFGGTRGTIGDITHYVAADHGNKIGNASWELDVYLSSTLVDAAALNANDLAANRGTDRVKVFSGTVALTSPELTIDIDDRFEYKGGNLLIEYDFRRFDGIAHAYDGPLWEAVDANPYLYRVTRHQLESNAALNWGALRTGLSVTPVPEPETYALLGLGMAAIVAARRRAKR